MGLAFETEIQSADSLDSQYHKGVLHLCETGITRLPNKYIFPIEDRRYNTLGEEQSTACSLDLKLPVIDIAQLQGPNRSQALKSLAKACEEYGFFQVINHGIPQEDLLNMIIMGKRFFELPFDERAKYMSGDLRAPVRYGTSFSQNLDKVFCWRDFLKLICHPLSEMLPFWPSSPVDLRQVAAHYSKQAKILFLMIMRAVLECLGLEPSTTEDENEENILEKFENGSHLMAINCYPQCPEPDLTLGMPPHSDYGFLTLLLQDEAKGLQILHEGNWITVKPLPNSFVINVGDHLEIFSNGRYKSVLHRVLVNSYKLRVSIASLHGLPFNTVVQPSPKLINEENPRRYKDTDFGSFIDYISTCEPKEKSFLESRKLT